MESACGNLLATQIDHRLRGIDTVEGSVCRGDCLSYGLPGAAATVKDGGGRCEVGEEAVEDSVEAGIVAEGVFVLVSELVVKFIRRDDGF